jgi:hypothetical protein
MQRDLTQTETALKQGDFVKYKTIIEPKNNSDNNGNFCNLFIITTGNNKE